MRNTYNLIRNKKKFKRMMEREINAEKKRFEFFHVSLLKLLPIKNQERTKVNANNCIIMQIPSRYLGI